MSRPARTDAGSAAVDFVLVSTLVLVLFLVVVQVAVVLHVRTVLVAAAAEGARYAADADRGAGDGEARARQAVGEALSVGSAGRMRYRSRLTSERGLRVVEVSITGPLPVVFLPVGPLRISVSGHAVKEGP